VNLGKISRFKGLITIIMLILAISALGFGSILHAQEEENLICEGDEVGSQLEEASTDSFWEETNFCNYSIDFGEILSGGVGPDGIPPIDEPVFDDIEAASEWLEDQSPVISVEVDGEARAYPLAIMTRHEIVNDQIGDTPVAVTFCPLCNSAIVFEREIEGETLRFGVSGFLRNSDLVMWDDQTKSWWQQLTGEGIVGDFTGTELTMLPSQVVGFAAFAEQYPDGEVLSPESGFGTYGTNPYVGYDSNPNPFLFRGVPDERLVATERVLAGIVDGQAIAYPFSVLEEERVINDTVGDREVVVFWSEGAASALDSATIDDSTDVGMATLFRRTLDDQTLTFSVDDDGNIIDDQTESVWNVFGTATEGELEGSQLRQELAAPHFWFAWAAFEPDTILYGEETTS